MTENSSTGRSPRGEALEQLTRYAENAGFRVPESTKDRWAKLLESGEKQENIREYIDRTKNHELNKNEGKMKFTIEMDSVVALELLGYIRKHEIVAKSFDKPAIKAGLKALEDGLSNALLFDGVGSATPLEKQKDKGFDID